ncbi:MAG: dienelactone hydrolase family protein [Candidatus Sulfobium sp.]|jgi:carboxymethylenebutenolidase
MVEDWLANAYAGMSASQLKGWTVAVGTGLAGYAAASSSVAGEVISTPVDGLAIADLTVRSGDFPVPVYEACPSDGGKYPVVLVIPEIFGMHEHIKDVARRFAREGFLAFTFEPYAREGGVLHLADIPSVRKVTDVIPGSRVMADLDALAAYAGKHPAALPDRMGVTGFCRGGLYTLLYAGRNRQIKAAVAWYGQIRPEKKPGVCIEGPLDVAASVACPVLGLYGAEDLGIPVSDVKEMEAALKRAGKTAEFVLYPGAPHAFFADYRPSYRPGAATDAWNRCLAWFGRYLKD